MQALARVLAGDDLRARLWRHVNRFHSELKRLGYRIGAEAPGPVTALVFSERDEAIAHWQGLLDAGVYTNLMVPPATPSGLNIVRISLSAAHGDDDISRIIDALEAQSKQLRPAVRPAISASV